MIRNEQLHSQKILVFWAPLAATWLMMAFEGPFLAAIIARLAGKTLVKTLRPRIAYAPVQYHQLRAAHYHQDKYP